METDHFSGPHPGSDGLLASLGSCTEPSLFRTIPVLKKKWKRFCSIRGPGECLAIIPGLRKLESLISL